MPFYFLETLREVVLSLLSLQPLLLDVRLHHPVHWDSAWPVRDHSSVRDVPPPKGFLVLEMPLKYGVGIARAEICHHRLVPFEGFVQRCGSPPQG